jgi:hypothetical protein
MATGHSHPQCTELGQSAELKTHVPQFPEVSSSYDVPTCSSRIRSN